ncbi:MAG: hypothetical protein JWP04_2781 [Belnapia sp.]|nr:hypothetical protein [Belnapia sp.]
MRPLPAAPTEIVVRKIAPVGQVGGDQILEGGPPDDRGGIVAEDVRDFLHLNICRCAGLGAVVVEDFGQNTSPLLPLGGAGADPGAVAPMSVFSDAPAPADLGAGDIRCLACRSSSMRPAAA